MVSTIERIVSILLRDMEPRKDMTKYLLLSSKLWLPLLASASPMSFPHNYLRKLKDAEKGNSRGQKIVVTTVKSADMADFS
jgi:hypothetical protein